MFSVDVVMAIVATAAFMVLLWIIHSSRAQRHDEPTQLYEEAQERYIETFTKWKKRQQEKEE